MDYMDYMVNGVKYAYNSLRNQEIKRKFVEREVYCCVTSMTEYILRKSLQDNNAPFCWDDVTNSYKAVCPNCGDDCSFEEIETLYKCLDCGEVFDDDIEYCPFCDEEDTCLEELSFVHKCRNCEHIVEDKDLLDTQPQDIYEWWMVSNWLARKLEDKGECVLVDEGIWGRSCTGQAILLDYIISQICYDMEILEGQQYEWKVS